MNYTSNMYLKFGISLVRECPALQCVCIHVFRYYFTVMSLKRDLFYFIAQTAHPLQTNKDILFDS
jgi:hypothetical protein